MFNNKKIFYIILILSFFLLLIYLQYNLSSDQSKEDELNIPNTNTSLKGIETPIIDENIIAKEQVDNIDELDNVNNDKNIEITKDKVIDKDNSETSGGTFDVVRIDRDGASVIAGRSEPNKKIKIYNEENLIGETNSDQTGQWVSVIDEQIPNEILNLKVSTSDHSGNNEIFSDQIVTVMPNKADELTADDQKDDNNIILLTQEDKASQILSDDPSFLQDENKVNIRTIDYNKEKLILGGNAEANTEINAYIDNKFMGSTRSDSLGKWILNINENIIPGDYEIRADMVSNDNFVIARTKTKFKSLFDNISDNFELNSITIRPGDNLWNISRTKYGSGMQYTILYLANSNQIVDPDLIFPGQVLMVPGS
jgi:hypothetical protein